MPAWRRPAAAPSAPAADQWRPGPGRRPGPGLSWPSRWDSATVL